MQNLLLSSRIKELCKVRKLTVKSLLECCEMNRNTIYDLEKKGSFPTGEKLSRIADYLDCSVDYLLGRTDNPQSHKMPVQRKPFSGVRPATIAAYGHETMGIDEKE